MVDYESRMKLWIESAKTSSQLATAAMFLPVFYIRELAAIEENAPVAASMNVYFLYSWIVFIVAIALSHTYQITATKLIATGGVFRFPLFPRTQYWLMVAALVLGLALFVRGAIDTMIV